MPAPYYILVPSGPKRGAPVVAHPTLESAETEAARLHELFRGTFLVRILETHRDFDAGPRSRKVLPKPTGPIVVFKQRRKIQACA